MINRANPTLCPSQIYQLFLIVGLFIMITTLIMHDRTSEESSLKVFEVMTHKGLISLHELNENVYKKFGYEIIQPTFPVPTLRMINEPTCDVVSASKILTVEYNQLTIQKEFRDRMSSILPIDFVKNWQKYAGTFDFAASFSSIEHSGLGRYGDPIDPIGDIREILKIKCILKPGGLLFLGLPLGTAAIQYNAHRIYGSVRLAMMFYGFEWLDTFTGDSEQAKDLNSERLHSKGVFEDTQNTIVLRKL